MAYVQIPPDSTGKKVFHTSSSLNGDVVYTQNVHLVDGANPSYAQKVTYDGAAAVTFLEGNPSITGYQILRVGEPTIIGGYEFTSADMLDLMTTSSLSGSSVTWESDKSRLVLSTSTDSGSHTNILTNRWHFYQPGMTNTYYINVSLSDTGVANNIRKWGAYDGDNGLFWGLSGSVPVVGHRTDIAGGGAVDAFIPQSQWNIDKLDGTGESGLTLDVTKITKYFITYAWPQASRFGITIGPNRYTCHLFSETNVSGLPLFRHPHLPAKVSNKNYGAAQITSCDVNWYGTEVSTDGKLDYTFWRYSEPEAENIKIPADGQHHQLMSVRCSRLDAASGGGNHVTIYPDNLNTYVEGGPIHVQMWVGGDVVDAVWQSGSGLLEWNSTGSYSSGSEGYGQTGWYIGTGVEEKELAEYFEENDEAWQTNADLSQPTWTFTAKCLSDTPATASVNITYKELR